MITEFGEFDNGFEEFDNGFEEFDNGFEEFDNGFEEFDNGFEEFNNGIWLIVSKPLSLHYNFLKNNFSENYNKH